MLAGSSAALGDTSLGTVVRNVGEPVCAWEIPGRLTAGGAGTFYQDKREFLSPSGH